MKWLIAFILLILPLSVHAQGYNIPFSPQAGGVFCDTAPTNLYCQDFEVTGSTCTSESPALDNDSADCGFTALAEGDTESAEISGAETMLGESSYTHNDASCVTFRLNITSYNSAGDAGTLYEARDSGAAATYPQLRAFSSEVIQFHCSNFSDAGTFAFATGTTYDIELEFVNSTGVGTWYVNGTEVASGCDGSNHQNDDEGFRFAGIDETTDLVFVIDNYFVTSGSCP